MAEDQNYKGEEWNNQAIKILNFLNWNMIGDSGMDLEGIDDRKQGVDCLYLLDDPSKNIPESVILEAKCYTTTSLSKTRLQSWVDVLNKKMGELRGSEELFKKFPILKDASTLKIGLIFIWFSDTDQYKSFRNKFLSMLSDIQVSPRSTKNSLIQKIYILDNYLISRICSLISIIKTIDNFTFYYPSDFIKERPVKRTKVLTISYIFSKFILGQEKTNNGVRNIVFYFGDLTIEAFSLLKSKLMTYSFIDSDSDLVIYHYQRDEEFRKVSPEIIKSYKEDGVNLELKNMNPCNELPDFIIN